MTLPCAPALARRACATLALAALISCAGSGAPQDAVVPTARVDTATSTLSARYAALAQAGGKVLRLDPAASRVRIYVFRGGSAARVGHNHVLSAPRFDGFVYLPEVGTDVSHAQFDLAFRLDELEIDVPDQRAGLGKAFASVLSVQAVNGTREHMLGESNMQAASFPLVRIHSLEVTGEGTHLGARIQVEMHGQVRELALALVATGLPDRLEVAGSFVLRQSDFGIAPYTVLGGLISVCDDVVVEFRLAGH